MSYFSKKSWRGESRNFSPASASPLASWEWMAPPKRHFGHSANGWPSASGPPQVSHRFIKRFARPRRRSSLQPDDSEIAGARLQSAFGKQRHQVGDLGPDFGLVRPDELGNLRPDVAGQPLPKPVVRHLEGVLLHAQFARRLGLGHFAAQMRLVIFGMARTRGGLADDFQRQFAVKIPAKSFIRNPADFLDGEVRVGQRNFFHLSAAGDFRFAAPLVLKMQPEHMAEETAELPGFPPFRRVQKSIPSVPRLQNALDKKILRVFLRRFQTHAPAELTTLNPWHTRVQVVSDGIPLTAPGAWDFTELNTMLTPIQGAGDHSPEFQIGTAPAYLSDSLGHILPGSIADFAQMSANIVRYYNTGGFTDSGTHYQSPTPYPVTWWGIFNEPDINNVTAAEYVTLYNTVVPQMAQADPSIKFLAVELAEAPDTYLPIFVAGVNANAPVDVVAKHFYSTCSQRDYDQTLFSTIPEFAREVQTMYAELAVNPALAAVPVWITENNVNADYDKGNGISACNAPQKFVLDTRGTSPFFAAWRSLVFQQLGEAGAQALYHWGFGTDQQYGEVDASGNPFFSYWVDYYLSHWLPSPPGQDILQTTTTGCCVPGILNGWLGSGGLLFDTQTMAARNPDGSVVILMSNYALQAASGNQANYDNNGPGSSRTFALDLSALGTFASGTLVTLDASTPAGGPLPQTLAPAAQMQVTLPGYGAALLRLSNAQPNLPAAGVANAASYTSGAVAPGEIVSLYGTALGPAAGAGLQLTDPLLVANALAGVHVLFDGVPAPIVYASAGQVNAVVPYAAAGQSTTTLQVEYLGAVSAPRYSTCSVVEY